MITFKAWIAITAKGNPAWFIGFYSTRGGLEENYLNERGQTLKAGGFKPQRVTVNSTRRSSK